MSLIPDFKTGSQIVIGCIVAAFLIYILGLIADKTGMVETDSLAALWWIIPIMLVILLFLIFRFRK